MVYIGIDVGGTTAKAGVVDEGGNILCKASCPTGIKRPFEDIAADMVELCRRVIRESGRAMAFPASRIPKAVWSPSATISAGWTGP